MKVSAVEWGMLKQTCVGSAASWLQCSLWLRYSFHKAFPELFKAAGVPWQQLPEEEMFNLHLGAAGHKGKISYQPKAQNFTHTHPKRSHLNKKTKTREVVYNKGPLFTFFCFVLFLYSLNIIWWYLTHRQKRLGRIWSRVIWGERASIDSMPPSG